MKTITLNGKKYIIPEKWSEVTLRMQMKVSADTEKITLEQLKKYAILSGYIGIPVEELKRINISELNEVFKSLKFLNTEITTEPIIEFDFNGKHYYCGQNLVDMEFQDFISIENLLTEYSGHTYDALPTILAIMCKQKKKIYKNKYTGKILHIIPIRIEEKKDVEETDGILETIDDYNVQERAKEFMDLPITIAQSLSLFFSTSETMFSNSIQLFSNPENLKAITEKQIDEAMNTLKQLGGKGLLTRWLAGILRWYLKYIRRQLRKHYTSIQ